MEEGQVVARNRIGTPWFRCGRARRTVCRRRSAYQVSAVAVAVVVAEVVRLPGIRRHDDGDAMLAEPPRADDEGAKATCPPARRARVHPRLASSPRGPRPPPSERTAAAGPRSAVISSLPESDSLGPGPEDLDGHPARVAQMLGSRAYPAGSCQRRRRLELPRLGRARRLSRCGSAPPPCPARSRAP